MRRKQGFPGWKSCLFILSIHQHPSYTDFLPIYSTTPDIFSSMTFSHKMTSDKVDAGGIKWQERNQKMTKQLCYSYVIWWYQAELAVRVNKNIRVENWKTKTISLKILNSFEEQLKSWVMNHFVKMKAKMHNLSHWRWTGGQKI